MEQITFETVRAKYFVGLTGVPRKQVIHISVIYCLDTSISVCRPHSHPIMVCLFTYYLLQLTRPKPTNLLPVPHL